MTDKDWNDSGAASDAPLPPPPPLPPLQVLPEYPQKRRTTQTPKQTQKPKQRKDFREILALFHEETMDSETIKRVWTSLYQTTLVESLDDHKKRRQQEQHGLKRKKSGEHDHGLMSTRRGLGVLSRHGNLSQDHIKRARQSSSVSTADLSESGKTSRLGGRFFKNVTKGSKLLQKFGGRT